MRKNRKIDIVVTVRLISWCVEVILAGLFIYAYITLMGLIKPLNVRLAVSILSTPLLVSFWAGCCIAIALIRERWILGDY